jgi:hypothetical protein
VSWRWTMRGSGIRAGPRTRLQPGGAIVLVMTRWGTRDLTAGVEAQTSHHADRWEVIEFPAILPSGKPLWPEFWKLEGVGGGSCVAVRAEVERDVSAAAD